MLRQSAEPLSKSAEPLSKQRAPPPAKVHITLEGLLAAPTPGSGASTTSAAALGPGAPDADALASLPQRRVALARLFLQRGQLLPLLMVLLLPLLRRAHSFKQRPLEHPSASLLHPIRRATVFTSQAPFSRSLGALSLFLGRRGTHCSQQTEKQPQAAQRAATGRTIRCSCSCATACRCSSASFRACSRSVASSCRRRASSDRAWSRRCTAASLCK